MGVATRQGLKLEDVAVRIEIGPFGSVVIPTEYLWPDGPPRTVTAARAFDEFLTACDGVSSNPFVVTVETPNPRWTQKEALFPELAPSRTVVESLAIPLDT